MDIMVEQKKEIEEENLDAIDSSLKKKDSLIKRIDEIDRLFLEEFTELKKENSITDIDDLDIGKYPNLGELKEEVKELSSTLLSLSLLDKENMDSLKVKLEETKTELSQVKKGKKAYKGYNYNFSHSILIDKRN